jgi:hypothetical protein
MFTPNSLGTINKLGELIFRQHNSFGKEKSEQTTSSINRGKGGGRRAVGEPPELRD